MRLFSFKYFNSKFLTLFLFILVLSTTVFAKSTSSFAGKVTAESLQRVQSALLKIGARDANSIKKLEIDLAASTAAHRIRLSEIFLKIKDDPEFLKQFPEYAKLAKNPSNTVERLLKHDGGKVDPEGELPMKALALLKGYDHRKPNKELPEEVDNEVRALLKEAVDDVNTLEKKYEMPDEQTDSLAEVLDYYDTYKSRQKEFAEAEGGRKLVGPSEWLDSPYVKKDPTEAGQKKLALQKRFAVYLETADPIEKDRKAFTQAADVLKKVGGNAKADIAKYFSSRGKELIKSGKPSSFALKMPRLPKGAGKAISTVAKGAPVLTGASIIADYLIDPDEFSIPQTVQDTIDGLTMTTSTSACATRICGEFIEKCGKKINAKNNYTDVTKHEDFGQCISDFFKLPLEEQAAQRHLDPDLNNMLAPFSPNIERLTCSRGVFAGAKTEKKIQPKEITIYVSKKYSTEPEVQSLQYNQAGNITLSTRLPEKADQLRFDKQKPFALRHCRSAQDCKEYSMKEIKNKKGYFWRDEDFMGGSPNGIPVQAFRWAKTQNALLELQSENIKNCCGSYKCRKLLEGTYATAYISPSFASKTSQVRAGK